MTRFTSGMTMRWACQGGDYLVWGRFQGIMAPSGKEYRLAALWVLRDGDSVLLSNRIDDLPSWFSLHPLEVSGTLVGWMQQKLVDGYKPDAPVEGPTVWRVVAGDRVGWVGSPSAGVDVVDGVVAVMEFRNNALVCVESADITDVRSATRGFTVAQPSPEAVALCNAGWRAVRAGGLPRVASADNQWCIG